VTDTSQLLRELHERYISGGDLSHAAGAEYRALVLAHCDELDRLRAEIGCLTAELAKSRAQYESRSPTPFAYDAVCAARTKWQALAEAFQKENQELKARLETAIAAMGPSGVPPLPETKK